MMRYRRDLQKLYKWATQNNIEIKETADLNEFCEAEALGQFIRDETGARLTIKPLRARLRAAVIAHELGHALQTEAIMRCPIAERELDAWARAEQLCQDLGVVFNKTFAKLKRDHLRYLATEPPDPWRRPQ